MFDKARILATVARLIDEATWSYAGSVTLKPNGRIATETKNCFGTYVLRHKGEICYVGIAGHGLKQGIKQRLESGHYSTTASPIRDGLVAAAMQEAPVEIIVCYCEIATAKRLEHILIAAYQPKWNKA